MLLINCPWCGPRDEEEFVFGGPASIERPSIEVSDAQWADYLFNRDNPLGLHRERWCHRAACGQWFNLLRHTVNHDIVAVYKMGEPAPVDAQCDQLLHETSVVDKTSAGRVGQ